MFPPGKWMGRTPMLHTLISMVHPGQVDRQLATGSIAAMCAGCASTTHCENAMFDVNMIEIFRNE
jgi:hypothetical protein